MKVEWPTIQGAWNPFLNKPTELNVTSYPWTERGAYKSVKPNAEEQMLEIKELGKVRGFILEEHPQEENEDLQLDPRFEFKPDMDQIKFHEEEEHIKHKESIRIYPEKFYYYSAISTMQFIAMRGL